MSTLMSTEEMARRLAEASLLAKFPEGKPADPTVNMTPEQAAEWKRQNEEHRDKFKTAEDTEGDAQARYEEGDMSPAEEAAWKKKHPELAENAENPPPEVQALKEKMQDKKASEDEIEFKVEVAGYEIEIEVKKKDQDILVEADQDLEAEKDIEGPGEPVVTVVSPQAVPPVMPPTWKAARGHEQAYLALAKDMETMLGALAQGHHGERVKAMTELLQSWSRKWGVGIGVRLQEVAEDLLYKAFNVNVTVAPAYVEEVMLKDYGSRMTWMRGASTRQRLTWDRKADGAVSDEEKAQGAEERAEADEEKAQAERHEAEADRSDATSKEAAGGLYGFTKATQSDVEASIRKAQKKALAIAKAAYGADERVATFLQTHAKRAKSDSAMLLLGAMKAIGPKIASAKTAGSGASNATYLDGLDSQKKAKILNAVAKHYGVSVREIEGELKDRDAEALYEYLAFDHGMAMQVYRDFKSMRLASDKAPAPASKEATAIGLYGFPRKTAMLGLNACTELRAYVGDVAADLHSRRTARYAHITGFLKEHGKQAKCGYSRMLLGCYPDAPAETKTASRPQSVSDWLAWDGE